MLSKTIDLKGMYIKWIVCQVNKEKRQIFSDAQEKWNETAKVTGFLGQTGGWDLKNKNMACIISFWESKIHLDNFMRTHHDHIFDNNKQAETYESIEIKYFNHKLKIKGISKSLGEAIKNAKLLKTAQSIVKSEKSKYFEEVQKNIWNLDMNESKEILHGVLSKAVDNSPNYLITAFTDGIKKNHTYTNTILTDFQENETLNQDMKTIKVRQIAVVDSWKIII